MFSCAVGRKEHCKRISLACVGSAGSVWATLGLPCSRHACFPWSTLLELQVALLGTKAGPGLHALPRFKPLGFRFSGTPQRHRLLWACVLASFWARTAQVRAAQATRCLESALSPGGRCVLSPPVPAPRFPGCAAGTRLRCAVCLIWGLISGCGPPGRCQPSRILGRFG